MITALYIDDEPAFLEIAKAFLENEGEIAVETVTSAMDALVKLETNEFDAIICDYQMPVVDGIQLLKTIRMQGRNTPFILFTGKGREDVAIDALNNGADFYLQKGGNPKTQFLELQNMVLRSVHQRRAEVAARESEEIYKELFKDNIEVMILVDPKTGIIADANIAAITFYGYSVEELSQMRVTQLASGTNGWPLNVMNQDQIGKDAKVVSQTKLANGTLRDVEIYSGMIRVHGRQLGYAIIHDITMRKLAEDKLWQTGSKLRAIIQTSPLAIISLDPDGSLATWNPAAEKMFAMEDASKVHPFPFLMEDNIEETKAIKEYVLKGERLFDMEVRRKTSEGQERIISLSTAPIMDQSGRFGGTIVVATDISERKKMEQRLIQLNEVLRLINGILRHDTLNELAVLKGSLEMYQKTRQDQYLTTAKSSVDRSVEMIRRMKELESLAISGGAFKVYRLRKLVEKVLEGYSLDSQIEGDCSIYADDAITSVIDNIMRNAIIHGKADRVEVKMWSDGEFCYLRIADNGMGIPEDIKRRIMEEGFSYGVNAGSGLGLYLVSKVVERYGGTLSAEDNEPKGTIFTLSLPMVVQVSNSGK